MIILAAYSIAVGVLASRSCLAQKDTNKLPSDLKIVADYFPGFSSAPPWTLTITSEGEATRIIRSGRRLTQAELKEIVAKVNRADYFKLPKYTGQIVLDLPERTLTITADKRTHKVVCFSRANDEDSKRFLMVWKEILDKCPEPKAD